MSLLHRLDPYVRRAITLSGLVLRPMTLGVRVLLRDEAARVLLVRHSYLPGWYLPGGGVEAGETTAAAAAREVLEEAGLIAGPLRLHGLYLNAGVSRRDHVACYVAESFTRPDPPRKPDREIAETGFFAIEALPETTTAATRRRIDEVCRGAAQTTLW